jgi:hypothetical protein
MTHSGHQQLNIAAVQLGPEPPFRQPQIAAVITAMSAQILNPRATCGDEIS